MYASLGHTAILGEPGCWNQAILGITPALGVDPRFLNYSLVSLRPTLLSMARSTTQNNLNAEQVGNLSLLLPSFEEQRNIADFLDTETSRIDQFISAHRRQIHLIEERELSSIYDALRGADEPGERKTSGLDWLREIPASWPVASVSSQFDIQLGKMLNEERTRGTNLKPYLRVLNVQWDDIDVEDLAQMNFPRSERKRYEVLPGDLLICEGGSYPGRAAIWEGQIPEIYYQKALHRARSRGRSSVRWLYYCLRVARAMSVFEVEGNSTTMTHLTGEQLAVHRFPFPEREVQDRLIRNLDEATKRNRLLRAALEKQLEVLTERRQALITMAVTGRIDMATAQQVKV